MLGQIKKKDRQGLLEKPLHKRGKRKKKKGTILLTAAKKTGETADRNAKTS